MDKELKVLDRGSTHKWLGCMLPHFKCGTSPSDCVKSVLCTQTIFGQKNVTMRDCFKYFDTMVTPAACSGAAHRNMYKQDLYKMDVVFRRLLCSIVGPPGNVDWTLLWHEILCHWNERTKFFAARHGLITWSPVCLGQYWRFAIGGHI